MRLRRMIFMLILSVAMMLKPAEVMAQEENQPEIAAEEKSEEEKAAEEQAKAEAKEKADSYARQPDTNSLQDWPKGPQVYADSAVVMDMESGAVLYAKQSDKKHYPASITKLMTTLVTLENAQLTDKVKFTEDSVSFLQWDDANIGMKPGEEISLKDALYGVLLASANEVSHAVAESVGAQHLGGDYDSFIAEMNKRAQELGCTNSHWVNANGLHDDEHYTTAHDMALIASNVYQQEEFRKIEESLEYKIGFTNITKEERVFQQNHKMLWPESEYYYEYCKGGKTGYTDQAKTTLVTMADNGNLQLAAVVLYDYGVDAYNDTRSMFDYVFKNFEKVPVTETADTDKIVSFQNRDAYVVVPKGTDLSKVSQEVVLTEDGIRSGRIVYTYQGQTVGSADVSLTEEYYQKLAGGDAAKSDSKEIENQGSTPQDEKEQTDKAESDKKQNSNKDLKLVIGITAAAIFLVIVIIAVMELCKKRRRRRK